MAGLIDARILQPELAGSFAAGYRGAEQARQQTQQNQQQFEMNQMKLAQLKQDRAAMLQLQERLRAAGQDPDLDKIFDAFSQSGIPDYVMKGAEGKRRLQEQREFARLQGLDMPGAAAPTGAAPTSAAAPAARNAMAPAAARFEEPTFGPEAAQGSFSDRFPGVSMEGGMLSSTPLPATDNLGTPVRMVGVVPRTEGMKGSFSERFPPQAPAAADAPVGETDIAYLRRQFNVGAAAPTPAAPASTNTLAPAAAPVTNAMLAPAAQPAATPAPASAAAPSVTNALVGGPNPELIAQTQNKINRLMQFAATASTPQIAQNAMSQARILQDQLELYSRRSPNEPAALQELRAYMAMSPEEKAAFEKLQKIKSPSVSASATAAGSPTGKSLSAEVGQRASTSLVKAEGAAGIMENANVVREALNTGNVIAGPLAGVRTKFAQVLELAGAGDKEKLVNTRNVIQGLASLTLESRAELKGQGQITDTETKLLERARSAEIGELTIAELQQVVNVSQRLANRMWSNHQTLLKTMRTDPNAADSLRYYEPNMSLPQAIGEGKPKAEADKRTQNLDKIFKQQPQQR